MPGDCFQQQMWVAIIFAQWGSLAQRNNIYEASDTRAVIVSRIHSLIHLALDLSWDLMTSKKYQQNKSIMENTSLFEGCSCILIGSNVLSVERHLTNERVVWYLLSEGLSQWLKEQVLTNVNVNTGPGHTVQVRREVLPRRKHSIATDLKLRLSCHRVATYNH